MRSPNAEQTQMPRSLRSASLCAAAQAEENPHPPQAAKKHSYREFSAYFALLRKAESLSVVNSAHHPRSSAFQNYVPLKYMAAHQFSPEEASASHLPWKSREQ